MGGGKPNRYEPSESLPIPTYEEAVSRPSSSLSFLGPSEVSHDAERQGLLSQSYALHNGYQPPTVESARSSLDFLPSSGASSRRASEEGLRGEMEQMEVLDPGVEPYAEASRGYRISKRRTNFTHSLSSIHLPFRQWLPSGNYIRARLPRFPQNWTVNWILLSRLFAMFLVVMLVWLLFVSDLFRVGQQNAPNEMFDPEQVRIFVQNHINTSYIREKAEYLTSYDHVAGTKGNLILGKWVEGVMAGAGLENVALERFDVYLNYPKKGGRRVAIIEPRDLAWEAALEEEYAYKVPPREQTLVFHGLSKSGNITGPLIYANYGSREDFQSLADKGVNITGSIALVRYYGTQTDRALKVKAAGLAGAVGCIIFNDPADDGAGKGKMYPRGRFMPIDGVQRGTVALTSWVAGDVLSSGFASLPGENKRTSKDDTAGLVKIPSIPLAARDARKLLEALKDYGHKGPKEWQGGLDLEYWSGDQSSPVVHLMNDQDEEERQPVYNVLGRITGMEQSEKSIIVGNHRDAWCFGAADPGSGTAVFLEVIRVFGMLKNRGWRPLRTIEFASWDAEEYNLIGSTEHVEARINDLRRDGFAYLNVDIAAVGDKFQAKGCPSFQKVLAKVLGRVDDPVRNKSLHSIWQEEKNQIGGLGAGSDFVAFQDMAGTSSLDLSFDGLPYPYHSCYDNFEWMARYGDPDFKYHTALAQVWALLILEMADSPILPLDTEHYASRVKEYVNDLDKYIKYKGNKKQSLQLQPLHQAADTFSRAANQFHAWDKAWEDVVYGQGGFESSVMAINRISHNTRLASFDTDLLDVDGGVSSPIIQPRAKFISICISWLWLTMYAATWPRAIQTHGFCPSFVVRL